MRDGRKNLTTALPSFRRSCSSQEFQPIDIKGLDGMEGLLSLFLKDGERRSAYLDKIFLAGRFLFELRLIFGCGAPPFLIILGLSNLLYQRELPSEPEPEGHSEPNPEKRQLSCLDPLDATLIRMQIPSSSLPEPPSSPPMRRPHLGLQQYPNPTSLMRRRGTTMPLR